jgi:DMSO/TMAO reductase YedYZ molybdopterin-dependent catalytic subunit
MLREVGTWNYTWLDVDPRVPIPQQVAERLKVRPEEIVIPPHVKLDLAKLE